MSDRSLTVMLFLIGLIVMVGGGSVATIWIRLLLDQVRDLQYRRVLIQRTDDTLVTVLEVDGELSEADAARIKQAFGDEASARTLVLAGGLTLRALVAESHVRMASDLQVQAQTEGWSDGLPPDVQRTVTPQDVLQANREALDREQEWLDSQPWPPKCTACGAGATLDERGLCAGCQLVSEELTKHVEAQLNGQARMAAQRAVSPDPEPGEWRPSEGLSLSALDEPKPRRGWSD